MKAIKLKIAEKGLKKTFLASKLGISPQLLTMYLNEKREMPKHIELLLIKLLE